MKRVVIALSLISVGAWAAESAHHQHAAMHAEAAAAVAATGVVKKTDLATGSVTIAHEAVQSLHWPAMTMGFKVRDKHLFEKLAVGHKVNFEFVQEDGGYVVTAVK